MVRDKNDVTWNQNDGAKKPFCAELRFYEELNDLLPAALQKTAFSYRFAQHPSVKDVIEAHHVPHTEVDLIVANGESVGFEYQLQDGDRVSVYPTFEAMDIRSIVRLRPAPLRRTAFILDVHLGTLTARLRMLGMDAVYGPEFDDDRMIEEALTTHRIILTRDRGLLQHRIVTHGYCVRSDDVVHQCREVIQRFDLGDSIRPFTRCIRCNGNLHPVRKEDIIDALQPLTRKYFDDFSACDRCGNVYWKGSHYEKLMQMVMALRQGSARST